MKVLTGKKMIKGCLVIIHAMIAITCFSQENTIAQKQSELIFQSGFEGSSRVVKDLGTDDDGALSEHIAENDNTLKIKSNWDKDRA